MTQKPVTQKQDSDAFVKLVTASGLPEADLWKAVLESAGIPVHLRHEALATVVPETVDRGRRPLGPPRPGGRGHGDLAGRARRADRRGRAHLSLLILAVVVGTLGLLALAAVVVGILWLIQFIVRNEERGARER